MSLLVKPGVDLGTVLAPGGAKILDALVSIAKLVPFDITITSGRDGVHSGPTDPHKTGEAFDLRTKTLSRDQKRLLLTLIQGALYPPPTGTAYASQRRFYAVLEDENGPNEHIHVQRRAGTVYTVYDYLGGL